MDIADPRAFVGSSIILPFLFRLICKWKQSLEILPMTNCGEIPKTNVPPCSSLKNCGSSTISGRKWIQRTPHSSFSRPTTIRGRHSRAAYPKFAFLQASRYVWLSRRGTKIDWAVNICLQATKYSKQFYCQFWFEDESEPIIVRARKLRRTRGLEDPNHGLGHTEVCLISHSLMAPTVILFQGYIGHTFLCPVPKDRCGKVPKIVSIASDSCNNTRNALKVVNNVAGPIK